MLFRELVVVCKTLNDYNIQTRNYFKYNADKLNARNVTAEIPRTGYESSTTGKLPRGCSYLGSSLILKDNIVLRHYFGGNVCNETIVCKNNTNNKSVVISTGKISMESISYVDIVAPYSRIGDMYELTIGKGSSTYTLTYGVLTYCKEAHVQTTNSDLINTCNAMYNYAIATKSYFDNF